MTLKIKFNCKGKITEGDHRGGEILIVPPDNNQLGYSIYVWPVDYKSNDMIFDSWVETEEDLYGFIEESNWIFDWNNFDKDSG